MALQVLQALPQLLGRVQRPQPGQLQANSEVQMPQNDTGYRATQGLNTLTGSPQNQSYNQNLYRVQPTGNFNQQQPNQLGVTYHNLQYLANPDTPAQVAFYNNITRFNNLSQAQRVHDLGQDRVYTPQDFQQLPAANPPTTNGRTQYFGGTAPNPSIKQRAENVVKVPINGGQTILNSLHKLIGLL